jgi:hypothetical protein
MMIGVNVSGAESWMPFVRAGDLASEGVTLVHLPISWEQMQSKLTLSSFNWTTLYLSIDLLFVGWIRS